jgi:hypothetical protein
MYQNNPLHTLKFTCPKSHFSSSLKFKPTFMFPNGPIRSKGQSNVTTDSQSTSLSWCRTLSGAQDEDFCYGQTITGLLKWGALFDEGMGLSFTNAIVPRQRSHSWARVLRVSWRYFTVSHSRRLQLGGQGPRVCIPPEHGPMHPCTGFPFLRLLRLSGRCWGCFNPSYLFRLCDWNFKFPCPLSTPSWCGQHGSDSPTSFLCWRYMSNLQWFDLCSFWPKCPPLASVV